MEDKNSEYNLTQITAPSSRNGSLQLEAQHIADYGAETELRRLLNTRHVTMIALGSSIGVGLWLGAGKSLAAGGPAAIFLGYVLAGSMVWAVSHSSGEMAVMYPVPSAFVQWVSCILDPKL
jgi:amino acid transporter